MSKQELYKTPTSPKPKIKYRYYVGVHSLDGKRDVFVSSKEPTQATHGTLYGYVIGPFRSKQGAVYMAKYGRDNPNLQTVADAENAAKQAKLGKSGY